jgi:hypothetical protein
MKGRRAGERGGDWTDDMTGYSIAPRGGAARIVADAEIGFGGERPRSAAEREAKDGNALAGGYASAFILL